MALWLNRSGRHCEHEDKFLKDNRIYLTWGGLDRALGKLKERKDLMAVLEEVYPKFKHFHRVQNSSAKTPGAPRGKRSNPCEGSEKERRGTRGRRCSSLGD